MSTQPIVSKKKFEELNALFDKLNIKDSDLHISYVLGRGKGGQKQNKTHNCVQLKHLPTNIVIQSQQSRSKQLNEYYAKRQLVERLAKEAGIPTKLSIKLEKMKKQKLRRKRRSKLRNNDEVPN